jgi:hypothetical protein
VEIYVQSCYMTSYTVQSYLYLPEMLSACTVYVLSFASRILHVRALVAVLCSNVRRRRMKLKINSLYWRANGHAYWQFSPTTKNISVGERDHWTLLRKKSVRVFSWDCDLCCHLQCFSRTLCGWQKNMARFGRVLFVNWSWRFNVS